MKKIFNMKRIIQLLLVLGIVVQSLLFIENVKKQNVNHWYHLFDENSVTISITEDNDVLYQNIQYLSEKYNVNFIKDFTLWDENGNYRLVKGVYLNHELNPNLAVTGRKLLPTDNETLSYLGSNQEENNNQIGTIHLALNDPQVEIRTLSSLKEENQLLSGTYQVQLGSVSSIDEFLNECSELFHISRDQLVTQSTYLNVGSSFSYLKVVLAVILVVICLLMVYYFISNMKTIAILKLNGYDDYRIYFKFSYEFLVVEILASIVSLIYVMVSHGNVGFNVTLSLLISYVIFIILTLLSSCIFFIFIRSMSLIEWLKGQLYSKLLVRFNTIFKGLLLIVMSVILSFSLVNLNESIQIQKRRKAWSSYEDYALLDYFDLRDIQREPHQEDLLGFYKLMNEDYQAYYVSLSDQVLKVNVNYLKTLDLTTEPIDEGMTQPIYYVPNSLKVSYGIQENTLVYYYDYSNEIFTFDPNTPYIKEPIIQVVTENNMDELDLLNLTYTGIGSPLKVSTQKIALDKINQYAKNYLNDDLGIPTYHTIRQVFMDGDIQNQNLFKTSMIILILSSFVYLLITIQSILIYEQVHIKQIMIKKIHGYDFKKIYQPYIFTTIKINILIILIFIATAYFFMNSTANNLYIETAINYKLFLFAFLLPILDTLISYFVIKNVENKQVMNFIKGEGYGNH